MRRQRSAKRLGTRHDLNYFKQWTGWRRARVVLAVAIPVIAVAWVVTAHVSGASHPANSGPLSRSHSFFTNDCASCHSTFVGGVRLSAFHQHTSDEACLTCHAAPAHHGNQTFTPTCGSCHVEHKGAARLAEVADSNCITCHANLKTTDGKLEVAAKVTNFNTDHPQFDALQSPDRDPGTIAFNHAVHMKGVLGPGNKMVQLDCVDCHRTAADQQLPWRFAQTDYQPEPAKPDRDYMIAPTYAATCAACHDLRFDPRFQQAAPHDKPEVVYAFLQKVYSGKVMPASLTSFRRIPGGSKARTNGLDAAADLLWGKTCKLCHALERDASKPVPVVAPSQITNVWFNHARFDHASHRSFTCVSCHVKAAGSTQTAEVLIPGITTCQTCHNGDPQQAGRSDNRCFECHDYHDWKHQPMFKGRYNINRLRSRRSGD